MVDSKVTGERVRVVVHHKVETQLAISLGIQVQVSMMNTEAWELPESDQVTKEAHLRFIRIIEISVKKKGRTEESLRADHRLAEGRHRRNPRHHRGPGEIAT